MKLMRWVFFILVSSTLISCGNDNDDSNVVAQHYVHKYGFDMSEEEWENREKEGQSISVLDDGVTVTNNYNNGVLHGPTTYTFPNSSIIEKVYVYEQGVLIKEISHDQTGLPYKEESNELDNKKIVTLWDNHGVPISVEEYEEDFLVSGKYFKPDNDLESTIFNGNGIRIKRDRNGELIYKDVMDRGLLTARTTYHPNGQVKSKMSYENYELHGEQITYSPKGSLMSRMTWDHGQLDGMKVLYREGSKIAEIPYVKGKKYGVERHFDTNGRLTEEIHWENDKKHGSHRVFKDEETLIKWYYKGKAVSLKRYEEFSHREQLVADKDQFMLMIENLDEKEAMKD